MTRRDLFRLAAGAALPAFTIPAAPPRSRYRLDWCDRVSMLAKDNTVVLRVSYQLSELGGPAGAPMSLIDELLAGPPGYRLDTRHVTLDDEGRRARVDELWTEFPPARPEAARG